MLLSVLSSAWWEQACAGTRGARTSLCGGARVAKFLSVLSSAWWEQRPVDLCASLALCVVSDVRRHARGAYLPEWKCACCRVFVRSKFGLVGAASRGPLRVFGFMRCIGRSPARVPPFAGVRVLPRLCASLALCVVSGVRRRVLMRFRLTIPLRRTTIPACKKYLTPRPPHPQSQQRTKEA